MFGVGFHIADTIARAAGVGADSPGARRAPPCIHVLTEAERDGSTCLPVAELAARGRRACSAARRRRPSLLGEMDDAGDLVIEVDDAGASGPTGPGTRGRARSARSPCSTRGREGPEVARCAEGRRADEPRGGCATRRRRRRPGGTSSPRPSRRPRCGRRSRSRLSIVTGGPGTGKTATIRLICAAAEEQDASIALLVAPTGRAARRMAESTGMRGLDDPLRARLDPRPRARRATRTPDADLLVVDETSMANLELLVTLLRAVGPGHARRARRRRRPARAGRRRQAVRRARGERARCRSPSSPTSSARPRAA